MDEPNLLIAFGGGILAFFSPCVLPMMPIYLASLVGPEFLNTTANPSSSTMSRHTAKHALAFISGFSLIFTSVGFIAGVTGTLIDPEHIAVRLVTGAVLIIFGGTMLVGLLWPKFSFEKRLPLPARVHGRLRSFTTGAVFTLAWTPCVTPILGGILTLAILGQNIANATLLLFVFSLGMAIPLMTIALVAGAVLPVIRRYQPVLNWAYIFGGIALLVTGLLILFGYLNLISSV
ncbi:cytochrome c biogenesis protein transmembrane region [Dehalogenimonas lykanthroporepellens BL-DC-9]|jgi:cytochrome c-type biogenesis protein|nr:cytochrome c biogenesis protein transmembrane region [Dehalogenimonas lykanthroporepellens BL-DC-9]